MVGSQPLPVGYGQVPLVVWADFNSGILFADQSRLQMVNPLGTRLRTIIDASPDRGVAYGVYADYHAKTSRIVYTSCEDVTSGDSSASGPTEAEQSPFGYDIATMDVDGSNHRKLTEDRRIHHYPAWSPDGLRVAFLSGQLSHGSFWEIRIIEDLESRDGAAVTLDYQEFGHSLAGYPPAWSPDGRRLAVLLEEGRAGSTDNRAMPWGLYAIEADGSGWRRVFGTMGAASWSPDGRRLAFPALVEGDVVVVTSKSDGSDIQVITTITDRATFVDRGGKYDYSSHPHPVLWSPDGAHLMHVCDAGVCVVDLAGQRIGASPPDLVVDEARWSRSDQWSWLPGRSRPVAAWSPDGSRIAVRTSRPDPRYGDPILFTMAPNGSGVDVLVRAGLGSVGGASASFGPASGLVAANAGFRDVERSRAACTAGFVVAAPAQNPGLVADCETLLGLRDALFGASLVPRRYWGVVATPTPTLSPTPTPSGGQGSPTEAGANQDQGWSTDGYVVSNWGPGTPVDQWVGVTVSGSPRRVTAVRLSKHGFSGTVPAALGQLAALTHLALSGHELTGSIPSALGQLAALTHLDLSHNHLTGPIPAELSQLDGLQEVRLSGNQLTGCVPVGLPVVDREALGLPACEAVT